VGDGGIQTERPDAPARVEANRVAVFVTRRVAGRVATTLGPGAVHSTAISASGADRADVGRVASGREAGHAVGAEPRVERLEVQSLHQVDLEIGRASCRERG